MEPNNMLFPKLRDRKKTALGRVCKTYSRGISSTITCFDAMNLLFAKNLTERKLKDGMRKRKQKLIIKELPNKVKSALSNDSLHVNIDDTFDQLAKGANFNQITVKDTNRNVGASTSDKSCSFYGSFNSRSPILTRSKSSQSKAEVKSSNETDSWFKQKTLSKNRIDNSLEIERVQNVMPVIKQIPDHESIVNLDHKNDSRLLTETANGIKSHNYEGSQITQNPSGDLNNCTSFFTNIFKEKIHSSTPLILKSKKYLTNQASSTTRNSDNELQGLIEQSFQEIEDWNSSFPTPQVRSGNLVRSYSLNSFPSLAFDRYQKQHNSNDGVVSQCNFTNRSLRKFDSKLGDSQFNTKLFNTQSKIYSLEEFENFQKKLTQSNPGSGTYPVTEQTRSFCLKKFEEFQEKYKNLPDFQNEDVSNEFFRDKFVTHRRHSRKRQVLSVNEKFNIKNLVVVLDDILLKNKTIDFKNKFKFENGTKMLKQPIVKLVRMSFNDVAEQSASRKSSTDWKSEEQNVKECSVHLTKLSEQESIFNTADKEEADYPPIRSNSLNRPSRTASHANQSSLSLPNDSRDPHKAATPKRTSHASPGRTEDARKELVVNLLKTHIIDCSNFNGTSCLNDSFDSNSEFVGFAGASAKPDDSKNCPAKRTETPKSLFVDLTNHDFLGDNFFQTNVYRLDKLNVRNFSTGFLQCEKATPLVKWNPGIIDLVDSSRFPKSSILDWIDSIKHSNKSKSSDQRKENSMLATLSKYNLEYRSYVNVSACSYDKKIPLGITDANDANIAVSAHPKDKKTELALTKESDKENRCPGRSAKPVNLPSSGRTPKKNAMSESCNITDASDIVDSSVAEDCFKSPLPANFFKQKFVTLRSGKPWRRSLLIRQRESVLNSVSSGPGVCPAHVSLSRQSMTMVPVASNVTKRNTSFLENYAKTVLSLQDGDDNESLGPALLGPHKPLPGITAKDLVLRRCGQVEPLPFEECYPESLLRDCKKIGEGVYGEVFLYKRRNTSTVMKVIPIEGAVEVNGERQKKFHEILSEIVISTELSGLRQGAVNHSSAFAEVKRICCVYGKYPERLLDLWDEYDTEKGSENDRPDTFDESQMYIVLDLANAGTDLEAFLFNNAAQALSMIRQVAYALAVAEQRLKFEHRDLHWGNVLLECVNRNAKLSCKLKDKRHEIGTMGVRATVIDFTLSRIEHDGVVIFNDLGRDPELFVAEGDYQFEVYRLMRRRNGNDWEKFEPYSNTLWLHYIVDKSITALRYKNVNTKIHKENIDVLQEIRNTILDYDSATDFIQSLC